MNILYGDNLILKILEKELKAMNSKAAKAKANSDAYLEAGTKLLELRRRFASIINDTGITNLTKAHKRELDEMVEEEAQLLKIHNQDFIKLLNAQSNAEIQRDELVSVISNLEWRLGLRRGKS